MPTILNAEQVAAQFSESLRVLAKLTGFSDQVVGLAECGVVLKACVGKTKIAKPEDIDNRSRKRALTKLGLTQPAVGGVSVNVGIRGPAGFVWFRTDGPHPRSKTKGGPKITGKPFQLAGRIPATGGGNLVQSIGSGRGTRKLTVHHFKPKDWFKIQSVSFDASQAIAKAIPAGQKAAGLARQAWVQMADDLGIILEDIPGGVSAATIQKARKAIASNGQSYTNGVGTQVYEQNRRFLATLTLSLPYWPQIHLDTVMLAVLAGRAKFYAQNVDRAVFASHAQTVAKYPWLKLVGAELPLAG